MPITLFKKPTTPDTYVRHPRLSSSSIDAMPTISDHFLSPTATKAARSEPKVVWALYGEKYWWPALLYPSLEALETGVSPILWARTHSDPKAFEKFKNHLAAMKHFNKGAALECLVFLGRSLDDFRIVHDQKTYRRFFGSQMKKMQASTICKPEAFSMNKKEYFAFHLGLDEAMNKTKDMDDRFRESFWAKKAYKAWKARPGQQKKQRRRKRQRRQVSRAA